MDSLYQHVLDSFIEIPLSDIQSFIDNTGSKDPYQDAMDLIFSDKFIQEKIPQSITDWILALNIAQNYKYIDKITSSSILFAKDHDLIPLTQSLQLHEINKERILRILKYLGILDNDMSVYDMFPDEVILNIFNNLRCRDIFLTCDFSRRFKSLCQSTDYLEFMKRKITMETGLVTKQYNLKQLNNICKLRERQYINSSSHSDDIIILSLDGNVYGWGPNKYGQLGILIRRRYVKDSNEGIREYLDHQIDINKLTPVPNLNNIIQGSIGRTHSLLLTAEGKVYACGNNHYGQLGLSDNIDRSTYTLIPSINNIVQVSAGTNHSLLLTIDGCVYAFGYNTTGALGLGNNIKIDIPVLISTLDNIIQISTGNDYSLVLTGDGQVYSFGTNFIGQLGLGDNMNRNIPTLVMSDIAAISTTRNHSLLLTKRGQVYGFGDNNYQQLGLGHNKNRNIPTLIPSLTNIIAVSAGSEYSVVLTSNGLIYSFGMFNHGERISTNQMSIPRLISGINNVIAISGGNHYLLILTADGQIYRYKNKLKPIYNVFSGKIN